MKMRNLITSRLLVLVLCGAAFVSGYLTSKAYACTRIQATCSYQVTQEICTYNGCRSCDQFGMPCCYDEYGYCLDDPYKQTYSEICFGICG